MRKLLTMLMVVLAITGIQVKEAEASVFGVAGVRYRYTLHPMAESEFRQYIVTRLREEYSDEPIKIYADENKRYSAEYDYILEELKENNVTSLDELNDEWLDLRIKEAYESYSSQWNTDLVKSGGIACLGLFVTIIILLALITKG